MIVGAAEVAYAQVNGGGRAAYRGFPQYWVWETADISGDFARSTAAALPSVAIIDNRVQGARR